MVGGSVQQDGGGQRGTLGTVRNATLLLRLLSEGPAHQQITELAERSGMSLPTVHRLLRSLVLAGLAEQHPESARYGLGPEVVRLSESYLARLPVVRALSPYLVQLRNDSKARIQVALLVGCEVVYVDRVDGEDAGPFRVPHRVHQALDTAAGRVLLARAGPVRWAEGLAATSGQVTEDDLRRWAEEPQVLLVPADAHGESEVAVPVLDARGNVLAALAAVGGVANFPAEVLTAEIAPQLQRAARSAASAHG
ncbi:allantoin degradation transcriptional regulator AllR [soil metagenome]